MLLACWICLATLDLRPVTAADLVGEWEGTSLCADKAKFPRVQDEHVVYYASAGPNGGVTVRANKVVNGQEEEMGTLEFQFDAQRRELVNHMTVQNGEVNTWRFVVARTWWAGTLRDPDGVVMRNISLKRRVKP